MVFVERTESSSHVKKYVVKLIKLKDTNLGSVDSYGHSFSLHTVKECTSFFVDILVDKRKKGKRLYNLRSRTLTVLVEHLYWTQPLTDVPRLRMDSSAV